MKNLFSKIKVTAIVAVMSLFSVNSFAQISTDPGLWNDNWYSNGNYAEVDLGLPSGTIWATSNVGTTEPRGLGKYYCWGDIEGMYPFSLQFQNEGVEQKQDLTLTQDAARVVLGGSWQMPTKADFEELIANCTYKQVLAHAGMSQSNCTDYYIPCLQFKSKKNGKILLLPAAGWYIGGSTDFKLNTEKDSGMCLYYWTRSSVTNDKYSAYALSMFVKDDYPLYMVGDAIQEYLSPWLKIDGACSDIGMQIRAVRKPLKPVVNPNTGKIIPVTIGNQTFNKLAK